MNLSKPQSQDSRQNLRKLIRQKRRDVPAQEQASSSQSVCEKILSSNIYQTSQHIALFLAADGEISLLEILKQAHLDGKACYLPVTRKDGVCELLFYRFKPDDALFKTRFGVMEPAHCLQQCLAKELDLVLTPLVAFDKQCSRMGMGKGYYDRTFAFKNRDLPGNGIENSELPEKKPILLGVAHECQRVDNLETAWWDVSLDTIITPAAQYGDSNLL